ncbi:MAG: alpha/beta hydrolase [Cytophagales bacterium]|nr:alpha/beta hydrolase [Cytophagales bacterium]
MKVYGIGGLGVDERVFSELKLNFELTPLKWINPKPDESISDYATRFSEQIDSSVPYAIIGVSFGGMLTIELNKILTPEKIILISSTTSKTNIPKVFRFLGQTGFFQLLPKSLLKPPPFLANFLFSVSEPQYKSKLKQIIKDTDVDFMRWALGEISKWNNREKANNIVSLHGSSDRLFKHPKNQDIFTISDAGHFMVMNRAEEVSEVLNQVITSKQIT